MAKPEDIAFLSMSMRTCYGTQWKHDTSEAMQVWANALARFNLQQITNALAKCIDHYVDFAPTLPQFLQVIRESVPLLPGSPEANKAKADKVFAYTNPQGPRYLGGNPFGITLPDSISKQRQGESIDEYSQRISDAMTFARYPSLSVEND